MMCMVTGPKGNHKGILTIYGPLTVACIYRGMGAQAPLLSVIQGNESLGGNWKVVWLEKSQRNLGKSRRKEGKEEKV